MGTTHHDRAVYERDGYVVLEESLDLTLVHQLHRALDAWPGRDAATGTYGILKNNVWREVPDVARLIDDGALAAIACELLGAAEIVLFQDNLVWKPPGGARIEWHQDYSYWPLDRPAGVTLWIALDDADAANGCMHYLPGTHLMGERQPADFISGTGQPQRGDLPPLEWRAREPDAVAAAVRAGQVVAHHPLVWHMSPANASHRVRRALTLTWILPTATWDPDHAPHPYLYALRPAAGERVAGEMFPRFGAVRTSSPS